MNIPMLSTISIIEHHVYLWVIPLQDENLVAALHQPSLLSPEERVRAGRLAGDNRQHYIVSHCALRIILGGLCGIAPHALRLRSMPGGRPELDRQGRCCPDDVGAFTRKAGSVPPLKQAVAEALI
jgi:hypothetical protein